MQLYFLLGILFCVVNALIGRDIREAEPNAFTFVVAIFKRNQIIDLERDLICAGTLVAKDSVLTAEHCFADEIVAGIQIHVGSRNLLQGRKFYPMWWVSYEQWCLQTNHPIRKSWNDIGVIRLLINVPDEVPFTSISPLERQNLFGVQGKLVGWGSSNNGLVPLNLQVGNVTILSNDDCERRVSSIVEKHIPIDHRLLCSVADPYLLVQQGDSGGAVFFEDKIIGITTGTCPLPENFSDPRKVNLHFLALYYQNFVTFLNEY